MGPKNRSQRGTPGYVLSLLLVMACGTKPESSATQTLDEPWSPQQGQLDENCEAETCIEVSSLTTSHVGSFRVMLNTSDNGPQAQWQTCFWEFTACWEERDEYSSCVMQATCPEPCKSEYNRILGESIDLGDQATAFEAVFIDDDAPCRPPVPEED